MRRTLLLTTILLGATGGLAAADGGGPSPGVSFGAPGILGPGGAVRFVVLDAPRGTTVAAIRVRGGSVARWKYLRGTFGIPSVAWDGSTGGLARNGRRLVLASPAGYGSTFTRFVVLDPRTFNVRSRLLLRGAFAFDAISPGGSLMYLLQYTGTPNDGRYAVRVLNLNTRRLYAGALVDKREPDEKMTGLAVTRTESRDGAWAYTLYSRPGKSAFLHALDTVHRRAFCVDLPWRNPANWISLVKMRVSGGELLLRARGKIVARVNTESFEVSRS
jgi:hypothetical protein